MGTVGVSVLGAHGQYQALLSEANIALAQQIAASIRTRLSDGQFTATNNNDTAPTVSAGVFNAFEQFQHGAFIQPGSGNDTIGSRSGADTIFGSLSMGAAAGSGHGNSSGNDAGLAAGAKEGVLFAGSGNATLVGGQSATGQDLFAQFKGETGAALQNFSGENTPLPQGPAQQSQTLDQTHGPNGVTVTLSDNSKVTFAGASSVDPSKVHVVPPHSF